MEKITHILKTKSLMEKKINLSRQKYSKRKRSIEIEIKESAKIKFFDAEPISQKKERQ